MKCSFGISNFLEEISSLSILLFSSILWLLRTALLSLLAILWNSAFKWEYLSFSPLFFTSLLFTAICKASSDNHFAFLHFFFLGMVLIPVCCTVSQTSVHSSSEAEDIKKRWQYYTAELYIKDLHDPDNHYGMITHLEPDILECEVKRALGTSLWTKLVEMMEFQLIYFKS